MAKSQLEKLGAINEVFDKIDVNPVYTDAYKNAVFWAWYMNDRPSSVKLRSIIAPNDEGCLPDDNILRSWAVEFAGQADSLDSRISSIVAEKESQIKIEMLNRHAEAGKQMIKWAMDYLEENIEQIRPNSALRMLELGIKTERQSRGLPELIAEVTDTTDEELMSKIQTLLGSGDILDAEFIEE